MARDDDETTMLLDDVTLLLRDDRGRPRNGRVPVGMVLAGAALAALDGAVRVSGIHEAGTRRGRVVPTGVPPSDARLVPLLDRVAGRKPKDTVWRLSSRGIGAGPARGAGADVAGGAWSARTSFGDRARCLPPHRVGAGPGHGHTAATVALLLVADVLRKVAPDLDRRVLRACARQIADSEWAGAAVKKAVDEMYTAVLAAVAAGGAASAIS